MSAAEPVDGAGPGPSAGSLDPQSPPLVVGLGPVGLTLALGLARAGVRSIAIDRKPMPDSHSRATLIVPRTLETFQRLGVLEAFLERGQLNRAIRLLRSGSRRELLRFDFAPLRSRTTTPYALAISQDRTERILLDAVRNTGLVDLRFGTALRSFTDHPDHISADLSSPAGPASLQAPSTS